MENAIRYLDGLDEEELVKLIFRKNTAMVKSFLEEKCGLDLF